MESQSTNTRYSNYDDIPLFLDALEIMNVLGLSKTTVYFMLRSDDFPTIEIGSRRMVRKEKLFEWIDAHEKPTAPVNPSSIGMGIIKAKNNRKGA
ncbi:MAG: helix-turn-helix domain-containing protein [Clostridia bacterium]|nr:helix-turn-helix domain-containing protein [Clostridia bacterium]